MSWKGHSGRGSLDTRRRQRSASRKRITRLLRRIGYETEEVQTGREALEAARALQPALALVEVNLPEVSGYEVCRELQERSATRSRSSFSPPIGPSRTTASRASSSERMTTSSSRSTPTSCLRGSGARCAASNLRVGGSTSEALRGRVESLTARELEVLRLLAGGLDQGEIARQLVISPKTVGTHIQRVLTKLGVHSRAQAVALAHEHGLAETEAHVPRRAADVA